MWRKSPNRPLLAEVVPSRWDDEPIVRAQSMLAGLAGVEGVSLEFAANADRLRFYVRAGSASVMERVRAQLGAAFPQAGLREIPTGERPDLDPAWQAQAEEAAGVELHLRHGRDLPLASDWHRRADPLKGVLAAAASAREGERVVCQLILAPTPAGWADGLRSKVAEPHVRTSHTSEAAPTQEILPLLALFGIGAAGVQGYLWYQSGDFLPLAGMGAAGLVGLPLAAALAARFMAGKQPMARDLVEEKLAHPTFAVHLRVVAFGPPGTSTERLRSLVRMVAEAYQAFDHPAGNGLRAHPWRGDPRQPVFEGGLLRNPDILNAAELAGLWHLPCDAAGPSAGERMASRRLLPAARNLGRGCRVGVSTQQGAAVPVQMPLSLLFRNQLIVAKTRRGKSTLLLHMASHLMQRMAAGRERTSLVVVDPHQDLAEPVLGAVPPGLEERVVYINLADRRRPVGVNLLDVALFPDRDRTAENVITMMNRLWPQNWGPRMEGALRAALSCLHEANSARGREEQYTLLDVLPMLTSADFREEVLKQVPDRALWVWWRDNYDRISRTFQQQTANPVTTKIGRFIVTEASRLALGQARSTIDPRALLRDGGVLVVNSAVGALGEGAAALMGATLLNLMGLVVEEQVALPPAERCRLVALIDESSTLGAADYGHMLSELAKYGASFVLVTQSLAKLDAIDRALRPTIFSNIDGLTVFQVSAEDARYLAPELGGDLEVADLIDQDDFECYARWWSDGRRLPAFSVRLDPPPPLDPERVAAIAERSAQRFGRPREEVLKQIDAVFAARGLKVGPSDGGAADSAADQGVQKVPQEVSPSGKENSKPRKRGRGDRRRKDDGHRA
jgi:hypothetical protein